MITLPPCMRASSMHGLGPGLQLNEPEGQGIKCQIMRSPGNVITRDIAGSEPCRALLGGLHMAISSRRDLPDVTNPCIT